MEARKRLYKAGPRDNPTLSERIKGNKNRRQTARFDKFAAGRQILVDHSSPLTPAPKRAIKVAKNDDRNQQLKAYRLQRNTQKLKQFQEQRSPFILAVPSGRWVEKKEKSAFRFGLNDTPMKTALMNERVLKKSTVKKLIARSTVKKENSAPFGEISAKPHAVKSKKKILAELNAVMTSDDSSPVLSPTDSELNSTFEIIPSTDKKKAELRVQFRRSNSLPELQLPSKKAPKTLKTTLEQVPKPIDVKRTKSAVPLNNIVAAKKVDLIKIASAKPVVSKQINPKPATAKAVILKPVVARKPLTKQAKETGPKMMKAAAMLTEEFVQEFIVIPAKAKSPEHSKTYNIHKVSMNTQKDFLDMQTKDILSNKDTFFELISEDQQTFVNQTIQQAKLVVSDKMSKFEEFLLKFESDRSQQDNPKRVTEDDVENYWYLIYDEIAIIKKDLEKILKMKYSAFSAVASHKKRRSRRTYVADEGTPKRSRRLAENAETPKHGTSCYGCITMSASKVNTPRSTHNRRTTMKKSVLFELAPETPKRSEGRRSSKRYKATPKRSLVRMNALDIDDDEGNELFVKGLNSP